MFELKIKQDLKAIERLSKKYPEVSKTVRISRLTEATLLLERTVRQKTPEGAGPIHLRDTVFQRVISYGASSGGTVRGTVGTPAVYGEPVEYGTKPHWPPPGPIEYWAVHKLGVSADEAKAVAFLIARKIAAKGTKGAHMFEKGFAEAEPAVRNILEQIPAEIERMLQ